MGRGKGSIASDQSIQERRLRPAYDFLDRGNYKRVIQETDRLLKKQHDFQCAKALKALALLRMGHVTECRVIIDALVTETPTEDNTIQALTICFRELGQPRMVCTILENASKVDKSEDLLSSCFMANVRVGDFQKQYQVALNLYKLHPKAPYFAWAVMSLFVKSEFDPDPSSRISLPLAEKMMGKFFEEKNHVESEHEINLYILILHRLGNYKKILSVIDRLVVFKTPVLIGHYYKVKIECIRKTEDAVTAAKYIESVILDNLGEWSYYESYIAHNGLVDTSGTLEFLDSLDKFLPGSPAISRTILLAPLFLYSYLAKNGSTDLFDPIRHLRKYLFYYGRLPSFFADVEPFFASITEEDMKSKIIHIVQEDVAEDREEFKLYAMLQPQQANDLQGKVNCCFTQRYLAPCENAETSPFSTVESCVLEYLTGLGELLKKDDTKLPLKECPLDFFINCASLTLIDRFWSPDMQWSWTAPEQKTSGAGDTNPSDASDKEKCGTEGINGDISCLELEDHKAFVPHQRDVGPLLAMSLLHYCLDKSPINSQTRLLLGKLYMRCGAMAAGMSTFESLDIKHLMLVSCSYLTTFKLLSSANYDEAFHSMNSIETFFSTFEKEGMEHSLSAYKYGSWEKILEFQKFRDHLLKSLLRPLVNAERIILEYATEGSTIHFPKSARKTDLQDDLLQNLDQLTDSRDFELIDTFKRQPNKEEWRQRSFEGQKAQLTVRHLLASLLNDVSHISELLRAHEPWEEQLTKVDGLLDQIEKAIETTETSRFEMTDVTIDVFWPPRIGQYLKGSCLRYLADLFRLAIDVGKNQAAVDFTSMCKKLRACADEVLKAPKVTDFEQVSLLDVGAILESLSELVETLSLSCQLLDSVSLMVKSLPGVARKSKKKQSKMTAETETVGKGQLLELINSTIDSLKSIDTFLSTFSSTLCNNYSSNWDSMSPFWRVQVPIPALHQEILPSSLPTVVSKLRSSYVTSTTNLSNQIQAKVTLLDKLSKSLESPTEA